ncbi:FAD-dependent oxidoreductase [Psychrobacter sp. FDAARGOS_221]|uniref:FAD-dependent oxidoreductase n=1 Tax=Psychrobacter sp. FDAARGOS_221 TaxID=1975705 RepID=UPI000BB56CF3|nr:FAD-dependent oxidoreductase [Psychrobacter sp. FDAARGOS_221]PNK61267.1 FAD-dependent oxidoreductase [Psychrobacter sp. FDAARGOS_221]
MINTTPKASIMDADVHTKLTQTDAPDHAHSPIKVGIIGGGVAGSTIAIRLAALGIDTYLLESKASLIDGPPMCHLHAGGNLYREIPDSDCVELLKQSIDMLRLYPYSIDVRPTVFAVPTRDDGDPQDLLPRLELLTQEYQQMIDDDPANKVLGEPEDYYRLYQRDQLEALIAESNSDSDNKSVEHANPKDKMDDWVTAAAQQLDLDKLKFPLIVAQEYGWNIFRLAASAQLALKSYPNAHLLLNTQVVDVTQTDSSNDNHKKWQLHYRTNQTDASKTVADTESTSASQPQLLEVDYLINACGFRTGVIDNMVGVSAERMVEFKASYVTHWDRNDNSGNDISSNSSTDTQTSNSNHRKLPEIIIHGTRGTPQGMVQLTPYPDGYYQIHSMNKKVTLFDDGLVAATKDDAQPELKDKYIDFIDEGWNPKTLQQRSQRAIEQVSEFVPRFASAKPTQNALYGGQQIPGDNDTLRVADISLYPEQHYARAENVKASSALEASDDLVRQLQQQQLIGAVESQNKARHQHQWHYLQQVDKAIIDQLAEQLTKQRAFPLPMAGVVTPYQP